MSLAHVGPGKNAAGGTGLDHGDRIALAVATVAIPPFDNIMYGGRSETGARQLLLQRIDIR